MKSETRLLSYNTLTGIFLRGMKQLSLAFLFCMAMVMQTGTARAVLPVTGVPVSGLEIFDDLMQDFMADNGLQGGILAISWEGCVVYQRGFGYAYNMSDPLPENTVMRLASVEKSHTAAVIRHLVADGVISLDDFVFDVGQNLGGKRALLDARMTPEEGQYSPYDGNYGNLPFLGSVTVDHLLDHMGGWDRGLVMEAFHPDKLFHIGNAIPTYPSDPPTREDIVRYMMSQPFEFEPGNRPPRCAFDGDKCLKVPVVPPANEDDPCFCDSYSNYGYMLLSLIIEQENVQQYTHTEMIHQRVFTPEMWVPSTEIIWGQDFRADQSPREPRYIHPHDCKNLNDPYHLPPPPLFNMVPCPYGGLLMAEKTGEGNLVGSAAPLLKFLDRYNAWTGALLISRINERKNGGLAGTSTMIRQWDDGFNIVVLFNESSPDLDFAGQMVADTYDRIDNPEPGDPVIDWPSLKCIDGFWIDFNAPSSGFGGHDDPFHTMDETLDAITDGTKLRIKPGTSNWNGTIWTRTLIDAPFGTAIIGQ